MCCTQRKFIVSWGSSVDLVTDIGGWISEYKIFFCPPNFQTGCEAYPAFYQWVAATPPPRKQGGRVVKLAIHLELVPRLKMSGWKSSFSNMP